MGGESRELHRSWWVAYTGKSTAPQQLVQTLVLPTTKLKIGEILWRLPVNLLFFPS